ncbi:MAG: cupredoxin domain-containing protein [Terriglobia bacterium]
MNRKLIQSRILIFFAMAFLLPGIQSVAAEQNTPVHEINMTAKKYEFDPSTITVKQGERVKLVITALDREHGFKLAAFDINEKLPKGKPVTVEFTASKPGTFKFNCSVFCGMGHSRMKGKLVVEPEHPRGNP